MCVSEMDGIGGYSVFFYLACSAVCVMAREADRETACVNSDGVPALSLALSPAVIQCVHAH